MQFIYLLCLLFGITGMAIIDWRFKLAFWYRRRQTVLVIASSVAVFIVWDLLGIALHIFHAGSGSYFLPLRLLPNFPIEEIFFLTLLCYSTLITYRFGEKQWPRT